VTHRKAYNTGALELRSRSMAATTTGEIRLIERRTASRELGEWCDGAGNRFLAARKRRGSKESAGIYGDAAAKTWVEAS
jgi:hypothetical protein